MAWNRSEKKVNITPPSNSRRNWTIYLLCAAVGIIALLFMFMTNLSQLTEKGDGSDARMIRDVAKKQQHARQDLITANAKAIQSQATTNGLKKALTQAEVIAQLKANRKVDFIDRTSGKRKVFDHYSDHQIARLLKIKPGDPIYGRLNYDDFAERFLESIKAPIIIEETDTEEEKALKKAVRETRLELKRRLDDGEDIGKILRDEERNLQVLAKENFTIKQEIQRLKKTGEITTENADDYIAAANKLLESKGFEPLKISSMWKHGLKEGKVEKK